MHHLSIPEIATIAGVIVVAIVFAFAVLVLTAGNDEWHEPDEDAPGSDGDGLGVFHGSEF